MAVDAAACRRQAFVLLAASLCLLLPGLSYPVLTIAGVVQPEALAQVAPQLLEAGVGESAIGQLKSLLNPAVTGMVTLTGGDLRSLVLGKLKSWLQNAIRDSEFGRVEVYRQSRSILGSVAHLFSVGSWVPAVLILLFSVVVPLAKAALFIAALFSSDAARRLCLLSFVESVGKWSMADVFVVGIFVAFLAAAASPAPGTQANLVAFEAELGAGFYYFALYCCFSLASSQYARKCFSQPPPSSSLSYRA